MADNACTPPPVLGVDVGGTHMQIGVVDGTGAILGRAARTTDVESGPAGVIAGIADGAREACAAADVALENLRAVGVATAGAIDMPRGVVLDAPNLGWNDVPLRDDLAAALGRPVALENDVNGAVWGEYHFGAGDGTGDALGVWVGTGVGGGLVLGGRLHHGAMWTAGEIGQTIINPPAPGAEPDAPRTVEHYCSRSGMRTQLARLLSGHPESILREMTAGDAMRIDTQVLHDAYREDDALTVAVVDRAADLLGVAIANWVTVLAIPLVIIGGGITETFGDPWLTRVRASFDEYVFPERSRACRLVPTKLRADAGLLGAALIALAHAE